MRFLWLLALAGIASAQSWIPQHSGTTVSLRGVSAVSPQVVWASGAKGTVLRTTDGGATWRSASAPGAADLDFRSIRAISESTAYLLSSGPGEQSRIYKRVEKALAPEGEWHLLLINPDPKGFWDAIAMWDDTHGIVIGDPVNGRFTVYITSDGTTWQQQKGPAAFPEEHLFAASGECIFTRGAREAWFGTGGLRGARVFHTDDGGKTWSVSKTPLRRDSANAGIFALAFADSRHGIAMGGDYARPADATGNIALTGDTGKTWEAPSSPPSGYRSAVAYLAYRNAWVATGPSGSGISVDGGKTWERFDQASYNAMSFVSGAGWAVGPEGAVAKFH